LWLGARYECAFGLLRRRGSRRGDLNSWACRSRRCKALEAADKIRDDLDQIIKSSGVRGIGVIVPVPVFNKIYAEPQYAAMISSDPYEWAVQLLWNQCVKGMEELGRNHSDLRAR
jgi:hypothetical protein